MPAIACSSSVLVEPAQYLDLEHALSTGDNEHKLQRRGCIPNPILVIIALALLASVSLISILVAWTIILHPGIGRTKIISVAQIFEMVASAFSILYVLLHAIAAGSNTSAQADTPSTSKLHKGCLILARLALVAWLICFVMTPVIFSNHQTCVPGTKVCRLQIADMVASSIGLVSIGVVLITLEFCKEPFGTARTPRNRTSTVRVSALTSLVDLLGRFATPHASRAPSLHTSDTNEKCPSRRETTHPGTYTQRLLRKPLPIRHSYHSDEAPPRPLTPLLPMVQRQSSHGWGEEWTHLLRDTSPKRKRRALPRLDSGFSLASKLSRSSSGSSGSISSKPSSTPRRCRNCKCTEIVSPSSSISNKSHRSSLSTVRSAEQPNVLIRSELRYSPSSPEWRTTSSTVNTHGRYRRSSPTLVPAPLMIRKSDDQLLQSQGSVAAGLTKRDTVEIKVPGAYLDSGEHRPSSSDEETHDRNMYEQTRSEAEYVSRIPSKRSQSRCPSRRPVGGVQKRSSVSSVSSRLRYREKRPVSQQDRDSHAEKIICGRKD